MSPTLLEFAVAIILIVVAWQIGVALAPTVMRALRGLKDDVETAADEGLSQTTTESVQHKQRKEHSNGTHH